MTDNAARLIYASANALLAETHPLIDFLLGHARGPPPRLIAEIGCGSGLLSASLAIRQPNALYYLGDLDPQVLSLAGRLASTLSAVLPERLNLLLGRIDVFNLRAAFDDESLDLVFSEGMMNLFEPDRQLQALKKQLEVADTVVAIMPNAAAPVIAEQYADPRNRAIWGHPTLPDEVVNRWRLGLNNAQVSVEVAYFLLGPPELQHQFAVVAKWKKPRRLAP